MKVVWEVPACRVGGCQAIISAAALPWYSQQSRLGLPLYRQRVQPSHWGLACLPAHERLARGHRQNAVNLIDAWTAWPAGSGRLCRRSGHGTIRRAAMGSSPAGSVLAFALLGARPPSLVFNFPRRAYSWATREACFLGLTLAALPLARGGCRSSSFGTADRSRERCLTVPILDTRRRPSSAGPRSPAVRFISPDKQQHPCTSLLAMGLSERARSSRACTACAPTSRWWR